MGQSDEGPRGCRCQAPCSYRTTPHRLITRASARQSPGLQSTGRRPVSYAQSPCPLRVEFGRLETLAAKTDWYSFFSCGDLSRGDERDTRHFGTR